jgi:predicted dehydrogenase
VVLDLMIHDLDLVLALERAPVEHVSACGFSVLTDAIDIANARIEFASGCVASVSASRVSQVPVRKLRVIRRHDYVSADLQNQRLRVVGKRGTAIRETERAFERIDALRLQAEAFVRAIRSKRAPAVGGGEGRRALDLALQVGALIRKRIARYAT